MDYSKIIKRSWYLTWKNKWLWVCGLVLSAFSGSMYRGGGSGSGSSSPSTSPTPNFDPSDIKEKTSYVLGAATNNLSDWLASVPVSNWVLIGTLVLLLIILGIVCSLVLRSWAKGALILGFEDAEKEIEVSLKTISSYGLANIKSLILYGIISGVMSFLITVALILVFGLVYFITTLLGNLGTVLLIILGIFAFIFLIYLLLIFAMVNVYAERLITIHSFSPWEAWKKGIVLSRHNFVNTLIMGSVNVFIGFITALLGLIVTVIVLGLPAYYIIYPIFKDGFSMPGFTQIVAIVVLVLIFSISTMVFNAVFEVFKYGNWNLFFSQAFKIKEENE